MVLSPRVVAPCPPGQTSVADVENGGSVAEQALQNQRRPEQHIEVTFDDRPPDAPEPASTPQTPDEVAPPARVPEPRGEPEPKAAGDRAERSG